MTMAALPETKTGTNGTGGEGRGTVGGKARGGHVLQERQGTHICMYVSA